MIYEIRKARPSTHAPQCSLEFPWNPETPKKTPGIPKIRVTFIFPPGKNRHYLELNRKRRSNLLSPTME